MSPELTTLFQNNESPFNGKTAFAYDWPISDVRSALKEFLIEVRKGGEDYFWINHDWWAHDKFMMAQNKIHFDQIMLKFNSDLDFMNSCDRDFAVSIAIYPVSYSWMVRFNIDESYDWDVERELAAFDISSLRLPNLEFFNKMESVDTTEYLKRISGD